MNTIIPVVIYIPSQDLQQKFPLHFPNYLLIRVGGKVVVLVSKTEILHMEHHLDTKIIVPTLGYPVEANNSNKRII